MSLFDQLGQAVGAMQGEGGNQNPLLQADRQVTLHGLRWWADDGLTAVEGRMGLSYSAVSRRTRSFAAVSSE
jgi:hypothetical protein